MTRKEHWDLGKAYFTNGETSKAEAHLTAAFRDLERAEPRSRELAELLSDMALLYRNEGRLEAAQAFFLWSLELRQMHYERALRWGKKKLTAQLKDDVRRTYSNLGLTYRTMAEGMKDNQERAEELFSEAIKYYRHFHDGHPPDGSEEEAWNAIGVGMINRDNPAWSGDLRHLKEAQTELEKAAKLMIVHLGEHRDYAWAKENLAHTNYVMAHNKGLSTAERKNLLASAKSDLKKACQIWENELAPRSDDTLAIYSNYVMLLKEQGSTEFTAARNKLDELVRRYQAAAGERLHPGYDNPPGSILWNDDARKVHDAATAMLPRNEANGQ